MASSEPTQSTCPDCGDPRDSGLCGACDNDRVSAEIAEEARRAEEATIERPGDDG